MVTKQDVEKALRQVFDPELNVDIMSLELIYNIAVKEDKVSIRMTFTSVGCPYGPELKNEVSKKVLEIPGVKGVDIDIVFDPPWQPSEAVKAMFGL